MRLEVERGGGHGTARSTVFGPMATSAERQLLLAPDAVARAAVGLAPGPRVALDAAPAAVVRRSYVDEVFGREDEELRQQVWMLHQPRDVRLSFVEHVLRKTEPEPREMIWMLRQDDELCASYARFVAARRGRALERLAAARSRRPRCA